jgi:hypothetical protein
MTDDEPLLKPDQAAKFLGVAVTTMAEWRTLGNGPPYVRLSSAHNSPVRYHPVALRKFVEERTHLCTTEYEEQCRPGHPKKRAA